MVRMLLTWDCSNPFGFENQVIRQKDRGIPFSPMACHTSYTSCCISAGMPIIEGYFPVASAMGGGRGGCRMTKTRHRSRALDKANITIETDRRAFLKASTATSVLAFGAGVGFARHARAETADDALSAGFRAPAGEARPLTIWQWMNGCVSKAGITADLEAFKAAGVGGVQQFMIGGSQATVTDPEVSILSPKWRELMTFAIEECARLGLSFGTHNSPGWDASAGSWVSAEQSMQKLVRTTTSVTGPQRFQAKLARPDVDPRWNFYRDIAVLAVPDIDPVPKAAIVDLTGKLKADGSLQWQVPAGKWTIIRFGHTPNGKTNKATAPLSASGLHCDMMSRSALEAYWRGYPEEIVKLAGDQAGKAFTRFEIDSYEAGPQDWTPLMAEAFRSRRGYDLLPWLPVLDGRTVESPEQTARFKRDWRKSIASLFADNYYGYMTELANKTPGIELVIEPYATGRDAPFDSLDIGGKGNALMCEFWQAPAKWGWDSVKPTASAAHRTGKRLVYAEAFTGQPQYAWRQDPYALKATGDRAFCGGVNRFAFHATAHNPWPQAKPGMTMGWWGTQFGPGQTWWEHGGPEWIAYLTRCQYLLQQGVFASDLCYLLNASGTPKMPAGFEGDIVAEADVLSGLAMRDGELGFEDGTHYSVLILPDDRAMTPALVTKIKALIMDGATVIGPKPQRSPSLENYPDCDREVAAIADSVWGDAPAGQRTLERGRIVWGKPLEQALTDLGIKPDVRLDGKTSLYWTHRSHPDAEIYFLSHPGDTALTTTVSFRQSGVTPELWFADTGEIVKAPNWVASGDRTDITLPFDPSGSVFVIFRKTSAAAVGEPARTEATRRDLDGPWQVQFPAKAKGAGQTYAFDHLQSWSKHIVADVRYFSGTAEYRKKVNLTGRDLKASQAQVLDLGQVKNIATVEVNGQEFPALWKPPYRVDITKALRRGTNHIAVRVTNLWPNRMIGDEQLPDDSVWGEEQTFGYVTPAARIGRPLIEIPDWLTNGTARPSPQRQTVNSFKFFTKDDPLLESGLLGPVAIITTVPKA